ncbi:hypothetical protein EIP91_002501 [Steccherinum ochraceum]|uniref:Uncharacterized protein n=1 Tax=Steccherinum ochraceum TaxID=92696 RepID=A0A4V2MWA6_9APHY|nr:hypothetical protein EIP91_002501 [Steccherinum ochraceum]
MTAPEIVERIDAEALIGDLRRDHGATKFTSSFRETLQIGKKGRDPFVAGASSTMRPQLIHGWRLRMKRADGMSNTRAAGSKLRDTAALNSRVQGLRVQTLCGGTTKYVD